MKVLIAEDDAVSRAIIKKTIEKLGHDCVATRDGQEAWEIYQDSPDVEAIVSDWMMPKMDGLEFCRKVRTEGRNGYTFFIFLTALGGKEHLLEGMEAGADEYLTKPLDSDSLKAKLDAAYEVTALKKHLGEDDAGLEADGEAADEADGAGDGANDGAGAENGSVPATSNLPARSKGRSVKAKVWDVLLSQGKITEKQLQQAVEAQKTDSRELGKILVSLGFISNADFAQAQAHRLGLTFVELNEKSVDKGALSLVPEKVLRRHGVLPLRIDERQRLVVAMSDPANVLALEDLGMISGRSVIPVVATEKEIQQIQNKLFAFGEEVTEILEGAGDDGLLDSAEVELGVESSADEAPVVRLVSSVLQQAVSDDASDIHIEPQEKKLMVRLRVDGVLRELMSIPPKLQSGVLARLKILASLDIAERRIPQDGRFAVRLGGQKVDLRVASLPTVYGEKIVLRLLDTSNATVDLEDLGFAPEILESYRKVFTQPYGTILVTGPTGSGKSTSLYATLNELNSPEKNIITVEDPVEYRMGGINQIQTNPKAGLTFASGLRSILRADPDIVMIGEIRDQETAKISIEAALTGHLVLATLHTNDAPGALGRLTDMGVEPFLVSSAVDCVIAQRLGRRLCSRCKEPVELDEAAFEALDFPVEHFSGEYDFHRAVGCEYCGDTGYKGRIGLYELMLVNEEMKNLILQRSSANEIGRAAEREGMVRLRDDGLMKAARGLTTTEEVLRTVV